jgi:hypothetical protein
MIWGIVESQGNSYKAVKAAIESKFAALSPKVDCLECSWGTLEVKWQGKRGWTKHLQPQGGVLRHHCDVGLELRI